MLLLIILKMNVLFICYGNVGRSQMAQAFYNKYTNSNDAKSAGVGSEIEFRHKRPTPDIIKVMLEEGIDLSHSVVKQVTEAMVNEADKIVVLCDLDDCPKFILNSEKMSHILVADPYGVSMEYVRSVRDDIKKMVLGIIGSR